MTLTQVALNVLNLNCLSSPLPLLHNCHRPSVTKPETRWVRFVTSSPLDGEMSDGERTDMRLTMRERPVCPEEAQVISRSVMPNCLGRRSVRRAWEDIIVFGMKLRSMVLFARRSWMELPGTVCHSVYQTKRRDTFARREKTDQQRFKLSGRKKFLFE